MPASAPFAIYTAFSSSPFGGNPAAVVFIPLDTSFEILQGLAKNFNQPMTAFVAPPSPPLVSAPTVAKAQIRYLTSTGLEVPLCGHATLCAAAAIRALPGFGAVEEIQFKAARAEKNLAVPVRVVDKQEGLLELGLPSSPPQPTSNAEEDRITRLVHRAFQGNSGREVSVVSVLVGGPGFAHAVLIEVGEDAQLATAKVDVSVFSETGFTQNIVTSRSSVPGEDYIYRMFAEVVPGGEDPVCGTAQCLMAPYWYSKNNLQAGQEVTSIAASARRGLLKVTWSEEGVLLRGTTAKAASGEVCF